MSGSDPRLGHVISDQVLEATECHGLYNSPHEGFAVIREELFEVSEAWVGVDNNFNKLDEAVRHDKSLCSHLYAAQGVRQSLHSALLETIDALVTVDRYIVSCASEVNEFGNLPIENRDEIIREIELLKGLYLGEENIEVHKMLKKVVKD